MRNSISSSRESICNKFYSFRGFIIFFPFHFSEIEEDASITLHKKISRFNDDQQVWGKRSDVFP